MNTPFLSVIIPLGPSEKGCLNSSAGSLLDDLQFLPKGSEIIFVGCESACPFPEEEGVVQQLGHYSVVWLYTEMGRAKQMNAGAELARGENLWFLHWDSRFQPDLVDTLIAQLERYPLALHYCLLAFMTDGPSSMIFNQWGANLRSLLLKVPFGDQGFFLQKKLFTRLDGYSEQATYGEDHLLVWQAHQESVPVKCCYKPLQTSARKYRKTGWLSLTCIYQFRWIRQAWPELLTLIKKRYF